nr:MAG TPA: hypothetical protein [Caudoviricetes sp.]
MFYRLGSLSLSHYKVTNNFRLVNRYYVKNEVVRYLILKIDLHILTLSEFRFLDTWGGIKII